jgi:hypothetical protein
MCGHLPNARMAQILLPQIELTLNMLRPANVRQTISAHSYVHGIQITTGCHLCHWVAKHNALLILNKEHRLDHTLWIRGTLEVQEIITEHTKFLCVKRERNE